MPRCVLAFIPTAFLQPAAAPTAATANAFRAIQGKISSSPILIPRNYLPTYLPPSKSIHVCQHYTVHNRQAVAPTPASLVLPPFLAGQRAGQVLGFQFCHSTSPATIPVPSRYTSISSPLHPFVAELRSPVPCALSPEAQWQSGFPRCPSRSRRRLDQSQEKLYLGCARVGGIGILACLGGPIGCWRCLPSPSCYHRPADRHLGSPSRRASLGFPSSRLPPRLFIHPLGTDFLPDVSQATTLPRSRGPAPPPLSPYPIRDWRVRILRLRPPPPPPILGLSQSARCPSWSLCCRNPPEGLPHPSDPPSFVNKRIGWTHTSVNTEAGLDAYRCFWKGTPSMLSSPPLLPRHAKHTCNKLFTTYLGS